jgi:hypothetical protein
LKGGTISKIGQALSDFFAARAIKKSPTLSALHERSEKLIFEIREGGIVGEDLARSWAQQTFEQLLPALNSSDPKTECRKLLVGWTLLLSDYQVITIRPSPAPDSTGLRGLQGISGELWDYRMELARTHVPIRDAIHAASLGESKKGVEYMIWGLAIQARYLVDMTNTARIAIDDYHHDLDLDWFHPMRYSFCVAAENNLRKLIGLPTSPDEDMAALMHITMMTFVQDGSRFPDVAWREHFRDQIKQGLVSPLRDQRRRGGEGRAGDYGAR